MDNDSGKKPHGQCGCTNGTCGICANRTQTTPCDNCERLEAKVKRRDEYRESLKFVIEQQKKQLEMCKEALTSIAAKDYPDQITETYWLGKSLPICAEVLANDTQIARECLAKLGEK